MPDELLIQSGLAGIRRARIAFAVLLVGAVALLSVMDRLVQAGLAWVPVAAFGIVALAWVTFVYRPCPRCGQLFLVAGNPAKNPFMLRFGVRPFTSACQHCGLSLTRGVNGRADG